MTEPRRIDDRPLPRPATDDAARRRALVRPRRGALPAHGRARARSSATWLGLHDADDQLGDGGRDALLAELDDDKAHLTAIEAIDAGRPVAVRPVRARPRAPQRPPGDLRPRRPAHLGAPLVRAGRDRRRALPPVRPRLRAARRSGWRPSPAGSRRCPPTSSARRPARPSRRSGSGSRSRSRRPAELPALFDEIVAAGTTVLGPAEQRRLRARVRRAPRSRSSCTGSGSRARSPNGTDDWPIGRERHDALVAHRAFDGLDADEILELGWQKLAEEKAARVAAAREIDPDATRPTVARPDQGRTSPADFDGALEALPRRRWSGRART